MARKQNVSLSDIRRKLKHGEMSNIANATNYSVGHVWHVLNGSRNNPNGEIVKEAMSITRRRR